MAGKIVLEAPDLIGESPQTNVKEILRRRAKGGDPAAQSHLSVHQRRPLGAFVSQAWPYVSPSTFLPNWHIEAMCRLLEMQTDGQIPRLVINMPPGYGKSVITSVCWPAWEWGPAERPKTRFLVVSYGGGDEAPAVRDAHQMRVLIGTPFYQKDFGLQFGLLDDQNAKDFYRNDKLGYRVSVGLDGGIPGQRADRILIDDPSKPEDIFSPAALRKPVDTWEHALRHRIVDEGSSVTLVMHRLHDDDLSGYFLKQDGWAHLRLPQFYEAARHSSVVLRGMTVFADPRTEEGQPLHRGLTLATADARQQMASRPDIAEGQQQQHPTSIAGLTIQTAWVKHWDRLPDAWDEMVIVVDCAFKDQKHNSFVVLECWGRRHGTAYLLDQLRGHYDLPKTIAALVEFAAAHPRATAKFVEAKANGIGVVQMLKDGMPGLMTTDDDPQVLKPFCAGSKEAKLSAVAPYFQAGNVLIPGVHATNGRGEKWVPGWIQEVTTFPKAGGHDDQVDCTSMGVWRLLYTFKVVLPASEAVQKGLDVWTPMHGLEHAVYGSHGGPAGALADAYGTDNGSPY